MVRRRDHGFRPAHRPASLPGRFVMKRVVLLALLAFVLVAPATWGQPSRHLVLISIDGLRPAFYLDDAYAAPALRALVAAGSHARAATPPFPSVTYPGHATIVTGVRPARHGILGNGRLVLRRARHRGAGGCGTALSRHARPAP